MLCVLFKCNYDSILLPYPRDGIEQSLEYSKLDFINVIKNLEAKFVRTNYGTMPVKS